MVKRYHPKAVLFNKNKNDNSRLNNLEQYAFNVINATYAMSNGHYLNKDKRYNRCLQIINDNKTLSEKQRNTILDIVDKRLTKIERSENFDIHEFDSFDYCNSDIRKRDSSFMKSTGDFKDRYRYSQKDYENEPVQYDDDNDPM